MRYWDEHKKTNSRICFKKHATYSINLIICIDKCLERMKTRKIRQNTIEQ